MYKRKKQKQEEEPEEGDDDVTMTRSIWEEMEEETNNNNDNDAVTVAVGPTTNAFLEKIRAHSHYSISFQKNPLPIAISANSLRRHIKTAESLKKLSFHFGLGMCKRWWHRQTGISKPCIGFNEIALNFTTPLGLSSLAALNSPP